MKKRLTLLSALFVTLLLTAPRPLAAQDAKPWDPGYADRFLQTASPLVNEKGILEALFTHRFNQPVISAGGNNLFGLDSGANIGLGVGYVPVDHLSVEVLRASTGGDYEFAAKYAFLSATEQRPFGIAVRAGLDWETKVQTPDKTGVFCQVLVAATIGDRVTVAAAPSYVSNTPQFKNVFNVPIDVQVRLGKGFFATGEYVFRNGDLPGSVGQWSFAIEKALWHHRFSIWIGNSAATTVDQMLGGDYAGGVRDSNIRLGFNIIRLFDVATR